MQTSQLKRRMVLLNGMSPDEAYPAGVHLLAYEAVFGSYGMQLSPISLISTRPTPRWTVENVTLDAAVSLVLPRTLRVLPDTSGLHWLPASVNGSYSRRNASAGPAS